MMKKLVILLAFLGLVLQTSCTSKDSQSDSEVAADYDSADLEKLEGDEALEIAGADSMASDQLPEDALGETTTTTETSTVTTEQQPGDSLATTEQLDIATNTETMPADPFAESSSSVTSEPPMDSSTTIVDAPTPDETSMVQSTTSTETSTYTETTTETKPLPSLQKVATTPWKVGGTLYNTVYFARPGDSLSSISQTIYGTPDRVDELKKGNTMFSRRDVKPGDKVYYNSPHRPDDASRVITYYEDNGIAPETYVANDGDNIRQISKSLLGYDGAWKEVWASNTVESKQGIPAGTELRYWKSSPMAAAPVQPPAQPSQELATSQPPASSLPPPPDMNQEMEQMPDMAQSEPPPMPEPAMDMPPPPPPMDLAQSEPPPPPPPPAPEAPPVSEASVDDSAPGMDSDTTMALGVVGLAAAGLALLIVMRKKRKQKELEQQGLDNTHVGT